MTRERPPSGVVRRQPFGDNPTVGVRGATTQRSILDAALGVFADHGFHATRVELITESAGCSRPAFYQYFSSKEDVFWRLAGHLAAELAALGADLGVPTADDAGVRALDRWVDRLVDLHADYHPVFNAFPSAFRERQPPGPLPAALTAPLRDAFAEVEAESIDPSAADPDALGVATVALLLRSVHYWLIGIEPLARERFTRALASTLHRALFGPLDDVNTDELVPAPVRPRPDLGPPIAPARDLRPRGRATRRALLEAGGVVLPRRGYHETRVDDIVSEAGVSHGSFYRYFANTDELFRVLAAEAVDQMGELVERLPDAVSDDLRSWLHDWFAAYRANGGVISAWKEIGPEEPEVEVLSNDLGDVLVHRLERVVAQRGFGDTTVDAIAMMALLEHVPYNVLVLHRIDEDAAIAATHRLLTRGVLGLGTG